MNEAGVSTNGITVYLVLSGAEARDFCLPECSTVADLLQRSGAVMADQAVLVDGDVSGEAEPLREGAVVTIIPRPDHRDRDQPWRVTIPALDDHELYREYLEILGTRRREESPPGSAE